MKIENEIFKKIDLKICEDFLRIPYKDTLYSRNNGMQKKIMLQFIDGDLFF